MVEQITLFSKFEREFIKHSLAQVISNPQLRVFGESREDVLKRLKCILRSHFHAKMGSGDFEVVNVDLDEILIEEVMET